SSESQADARRRDARRHGGPPREPEVLRRRPLLDRRHRPLRIYARRQRGWLRAGPLSRGLGLARACPAAARSRPHHAKGLAASDAVRRRPSPRFSLTAASCAAWLAGHVVYRGSLGRGAGAGDVVLPAATEPSDRIEPL